MKVSALLVVALATALSFGQEGVGAGPRRGVLAQKLPEIVRKALRSQRFLKFQGRRVVTIRREGKSSSFEDLVWQDGRMTRVEFPPGSTRAGQIIVEANGQRQHYFPAENEIEVSSVRGPGGLPGGNMGPLSRRPEAQYLLGGNELVAGVSCQIVDGEGPMGGKLRLWIDPLTGTLLKRENYDKGGQLVAGFEFKQIDLSVEIPASKFALKISSVKIVSPQDRMERTAKQHGPTFASFFALQLGWR